MTPALRAALVLGASLLFAGPAWSADDLTARILTRGTVAPGQDIELQVEVSWEGRPERAAPGVPRIALPEGAGLRLGRTGSSFDGTRSKWWTNGVVTLPDASRGPWDIGPAEVDVARPGGTTETITAAAKTLGRRARRNLLGQGLASAVVVALALGAFGWMWRRTTPEPDALPGLLAALHSALDGTDPEAVLDHGLALHTHLTGHRVAKDYLPPAAGLTERREAIRFGGDGVTVAEVRPLVAPLIAIAGALAHDRPGV